MYSYTLKGYACLNMECSQSVYLPQRTPGIWAAMFRSEAKRDFACVKVGKGVVNESLWPVLLCWQLLRVCDKFKRKLKQVLNVDILQFFSLGFIQVTGKSGVIEDNLEHNCT